MENNGNRSIIQYNIKHNQGQKHETPNSDIHGTKNNRNTRQGRKHITVGTETKRKH